VTCFNLVDLNEMLWEFWFPGIAALAGGLVLLRRPLRLLKIADRNDRVRDGIIALTVLAIAAPAIILQHYYSAASGHLVELQKPSELFSAPAERYYSIKNYKVWDDQPFTYRTSKVTGKHGENFDMSCYHVFPLTDREDRIAYTKTWFAINYSKSVKYRSIESEESELNIFYSECLRELQTYDFYSCSYFLRTPNNDDRKNFIAAAHLAIPSVAEEEIIILEPQQGKFEDRSGTLLAWIFRSAGIGFLVFFLIVWLVPHSETELKRLERGKPIQNDVAADMVRYLIPRNDHIVQSVIIDLYLLLFVIMVLAGVHPVYPDGKDLIDWGALYGPLMEAGQYWRLLTAAFLHYGFLHLTMNILGFAIGVALLENKFNQRQFLLLFLLCTIGASVISLWWNPSGIKIGASGSVFGLYGAVVGLILSGALPYRLHARKLLLVFFIVIANLVYGLAKTNVDNAAHLGGFITGVLAGGIIFFSNRANRELYRLPKIGKLRTRK
jgi:rhomboid protease GluP